VLLPDGTHVNQQLVNQGLCWWYRKYAPGDTVLEGLESEAREARKGLWLIRHLSHRGSIGKRGGGNHSTSQISYRWMLRPKVVRPLVALHFWEP